MPLCVKGLFSGAVGRVELARAWVVGLGVVLGRVREVTYPKCRCIRV